MALYENVFIARQDITAQQVTEMTDAFAGIITAQGGKVTKTESWGLRSLAYKIQKNKKGHYVMFNIDAPPAAVIELERNMRINEDVLRYMTVKVDELEEGPSAMLRKEREREFGDDFGRPSRGGFGGGFGDRPKRSRSDNEGDN